MRLGIYGTGGSGREVFDMIEMNPSLKKCWDEIIFIDDTKHNPPAKRAGYCQQAAAGWIFI